MATLRRVRPRDGGHPPVSVTSAIPRPDRIRCITCGMPVRGGATVCWSCGSDPRSADAPVAADDTGPTVERRPRTVAGIALRLAGVVVVAALIVGVAVVLLPSRTSPVRTLADSITGRGWQIATRPQLVVDLPGTATDRRLDASILGPFDQGSALDATGSGLHAIVATLHVSPPGATLTLTDLSAKFAATNGLRITSSASSVFAGATSLRSEATATSGGRRRAWVEAVVIGDHAYVLALTGEVALPTTADRDRLLASFGVTDR